jgi:hypothetical protein
MKIRTSCLFPVTAILLIILEFNFQKVTAQLSANDATVKERIDYIQNVLDGGEKGAKLWWNGWLIGYSAATVVQGAVLITSNDKSTREDMTTGAVTTLLGAVGQLITPMVPAKAPEELKRMAGETNEERTVKLAYAEELLKRSALREKSGRSWQTHAVAGVVNLSSGLITWLGFKRTIWAGIGNFALNTAVTEAQIWTQPTKAMRDYEDYCQKYIPGNTTGRLKPDVDWYVGVYPGGLGIRVVF